ncbi:DNA topoisomerase III [Colwellia psychrerythraea]|uniref:DNA topoisomerase n=1 Tax=Colwellia psychrerythraea (strain 34H / ATCC BAA-681) TaxID=167879 RepID=Q47UU1_COLP3|nr:DNA topoisomerase III [Colwellia psychrerythraea]AAZ28203.1 DNA topoisomerase III [Colwellia psychrerythraea 34H]
MKLYIAEKPSLGRAIAAALPKPQKNHKTHIELANGDVVSWCIGHILAQADPEDYDAELKKWRMESLPIVPQQWQLKPIARTRSQLTVLRKLVKQADEIIHAGDPDREGQLLVDEVIDYFKLSKTKKANIKRLLISDLNLPAVKRALTSLKPNSDFMPLSISALARSRADWLYGINLTRAYTLQGQKTGYNSVLSVGRVQTPLLGLVVRREQEISEFVSKPFFQVQAHIALSSKDAVAFTAKWQPSENCQPYCDEEGRVLVKALAENVVKRIANQPATISNIDSNEKQQAAPLPFNLSQLQISAAKQFSMNAKLVLDVCQALYERHKLITYPRSDCRYLPKEQLKQASGIVNTLANSSLPCNKPAQGANTSFVSKAWNDKKITAHHAIIPTEKSPENINLNTFEKNVYLLIVRQYLVQFYPAYIFQQTKVELLIAGGNFMSQAKTEKQLGWQVLFPKSNKTNNQSKLEHGQEQEQTLPPLTKGQLLHCQQGELIEKHTSPPQSFTDATLLGAMTGISRYVNDAAIKKVLKETDGLGTDATRAGIIDLLFKRGFLQRQGKAITATKVGVALITALPTMATLPDMTAQWEATLTAISEKNANYLSFMQPLTVIVNEMVQGASQQSFSGLPKVAFKPKRGKRTFQKKAVKKAS